MSYRPSQNEQWQANVAQGYDLASFHINEQGKYATRPQGKQRVKWTEPGWMFF